MVARFRETCSASDQRDSGRHRAFNDVSVEDIHSRKSLIYNMRYFVFFYFFEIGCTTFRPLCMSTSANLLQN